MKLNGVANIMQKTECENNKKRKIRTKSDAQEVGDGGWAIPLSSPHDPLANLSLAPHKAPLNDGG